LNDASATEYERLDLMSKILDPWTRGYLTALGQDIRGRDRGARYFQLFFAEVRDRVIGAGQLDAATIDAASALLDDPNYWTQCWMMTAVWLRKSLSD
jgi:hypothetical protein